MAKKVRPDVSGRETIEQCSIVVPRLRGAFLNAGAMNNGSNGGDVWQGTSNFSLSSGKE